jgi:type II secretory pathway pseudopilin PulG
MTKHSDEHSYYPQHLALVAALFLPLGAIALVSDTASAQLLQQQQQQQQQRQQQLQQRQQHAQVRRTATRINPPERANTTPDTTAVPVPLPSPEIDKTSALGQALAACNQDAAVQEAFTLPGLKGEVTLDRCYKGRAHLTCVFTALSTEAKSLTSSYRKIVDAKYPDLTTVDGVCQLNPETLATNIVGSDDFAKRFKELKSQYEVTTYCAGNVEQAFKNVTLNDMTQAPEVLKSMTASIDGDVAKISKVHEQISELAEKMELSKKAMKTVTKIYHAMCLQGARAAENLEGKKHQSYAE